ncbi:MAG: HAD-IA family hydrolase [Lachnospira sp.]|nr:HAD-IA family hydrolase [Lachnospira sp.]
MIKGIIFDMDGILIDSERESDEAWEWASKQRGADMPKWLIDSFKGAPTHMSEKYFNDYYNGKFDYWDLRGLRTEYIYKNRETNGIAVKPGIYELFEYIKKNGLKCAVATSTRRESAYRTLHIIGVWEYLSAVAFGDEVQNGKPAPDIFLKAAADLGLEPEECVVIEDSINGIKAGYNAKIPVIHVPDTIEIDDEIKALTTVICKDLKEVIGVLESMDTGSTPVYTNKLNRPAIKYIFNKYVSPYNVFEDRIKLKIEHTFRVASNCERIAKSLNLSDADVDMVWFLGMFHDIGRFEQVRRFGTFNDAESINHGELSADIICKAKGAGIGAECFGGAKMLCKEIADAAGRGVVVDMDIVELAIRQHNAYRLPEDLSEREWLFSNILRDADKIDILKVCVEEPVEAVFMCSEEELYNSDITEEVMDAFFEGKAVLKSIRKTAIDKLVGHISLVNELVYPESIVIVKEQGYLDRMLNFPTKNDGAREKLARIRENMMGRPGYNMAWRR